MPPRGRPGSSHSSRPAPSSSHRPSSSHSSSRSSSSHSHSHRSAPSYRHTPSRGFRHSGYGRYNGGTSGSGEGCTGCSGCAGLITLVVLMAIIAVVVFFVIRRQNADTRQQQSYSSQSPESHDPIYVPALERKVQWNNEYDSYYDQPTDCYFFLNTDMEPPIWQYWYEGTSSDYGDYGWMEWDAQEKRWYIETGETTWIPLPAGKEKSYFWHFD